MAIGTIVAVAAILCSVGADARWLAALGRVIAPHLDIPAGVPFAAAPSSHWHNVLVLAELAFNGLESSLGDRGLMVAQLLALALALAALARDAREEGATPNGTAIVLWLVAIGAAPSLAIVRVQLFSLVFFPVLVALLRSDARRPSPRIWLIVPLLALWGNLHGAALIGLLVTLGYLSVRRFRDDRLTAVALAVTSSLALCLTPALAGTITYYHDVLTSVAATRGTGQWSRLSLASPVDDLAIAVALVLGWFALRGRLRPWEAAVALGLAVLSIRAARSAVWLLFFLAPPAARSIEVRREWGYLTPIVTTVALAAIALATVRGPAFGGAPRQLIARAVLLAHGTPVLAPDLLAEQVALAPGRIWIGNPLDAFSARDQATYLDWSSGRASGEAALTPAIRIVLVSRGSAAQRLMARAPGFTPVAADRTFVIYRRVSSLR
jgi:hypothetical protein